MAEYNTLVYWVIFVVAIFVVVAISFITGIIACFRPCCITRTIKDPEGDNLISKSMQTDEIVEEEDETDQQGPPPVQEEPEDVIFVTKHTNNKFSVDRKKSTISALQSVDRQELYYQSNNLSPTDLGVSLDSHRQSAYINPSIPDRRSSAIAINNGLQYAPIYPPLPSSASFMPKINSIDNNNKILISPAAPQPTIITDKY